MNKLTNVLKNTAWFSVGLTAIAVEKTHAGVNTIIKEVESGRPQELVRDKYTFVKDKVSSIINDTKSNARYTDEEYLEDCEKAGIEVH